MSQAIDREVLLQVAEMMLAGKTDQQMLEQLLACGCSGCPIDTTWDGKPSGRICQCPRRCRCACTLPTIAEANRERREYMAGLLARAKHHIVEQLIAPEGEL